MADKKSIYGLIGFPLGHSLSPVMHNAAFELLGIDATYELFPLESDKLADFFAKLREESCDIAGLNVTIPYKENVIKYLDGLSPFALKVMAVNTIIISPARNVSGFNTDGPGFLAHLAELGVETKNKRIALLGAGGAARAIVSVLCLISERPESIRIYDIDLSRARALTDDLGSRIDLSPVQVVENIDDLGIDGSDILINATPVGMKKNDPLIINPDFLHSNLFVYDLIYNPQETRLLSMAKLRRAKTSNGLGMLFCQGVLALQHWTGLDLDSSIKGKMREALYKAL